MHITDRELWTLVHGMGFGAAYLLAFAGGLAGLYSLRPQWVTAEGVSERIMRLRWGMVLMRLGYGLRSMRDRARLLGGQLDIESTLGKGTKVILTLSEEKN